MKSSVLQILILVLCSSASFAFQSGQPYVSPFSSYNYTTGALTEQPVVQPMVVAEPPVNAWSPAPWPTAAGGAGCCDNSYPQYGHSAFAAAAPVQNYCETCPPCEQNVCNPCCSSPCDESNRWFAFEAGPVFLYRNRPDSRRLFFTPGSASERIDASHFYPNTAPGVETSLIWYNQKSGSDLEVRTLWTDDWDSRVDRAFTGTSVQIDSNPIVGTSAPRNGAAFYSSRFGSIEVNARRRRCDTTLIGGFRFMNLNERLNATLSDPGGIIPDELIRSRTRNRLYGFHLGADRVVSSQYRCCVKLTGRVGLYANDSEQQTQLISLASPPATFPTRGSDVDFAFHAEAGVLAKLRLTSCASLTAGYRLIFIDGLALATEQIGSANFTAGTGLNDNSSLLLHAANVGIELAY